MRSASAGGLEDSAGVGPRRHPAEFEVRSFLVVVASPSLEHGADVRQRAAQRLVQKLVPQPAVEAFDEAVLLRLARRDAMPADACSSAQLKIAFEVKSVALVAPTPELP